MSLLEAARCWNTGVREKLPYHAYGSMFTDDTRGNESLARRLESTTETTLYTCDTPECQNLQTTVTPNGYFCHECAATENEPVLLADGGVDWHGLTALERVVARLESRLEDLEVVHRETNVKLEAFKRENDALRERNETLRERVERLESARKPTGATRPTEAGRLEDVETQLESVREKTAQNAAAVDAAHRRSGANKTRLEELQARELEKGAHLRADNVDVHELDLEVDHLERLDTEDGSMYRLPETEDPLERSTTELSHGDLLPIQQLARMDADMLRSTTSSLPSRLAAKLWRARADPDVGDDPWQCGCKTIREYVKASDLKHWIRRQEPGTSETYAKKLVSRTIDAILELSGNRLAVRKKNERKNGLRYTERRLILTADADIPGELSSPTTDSSQNARATSPETADVHGGD